MSKQISKVLTVFVVYDVNWQPYITYRENPLLLAPLNPLKFGLFQTEGVCRRQFQILWKRDKVLYKGRKHCGKRRNCSLRAISPFPSVFSKDLYCRHVKTRACLRKG